MKVYVLLYVLILNLVLFSCNRDKDRKSEVITDNQLRNTLNYKKVHQDSLQFDHNQLWESLTKKAHKIPKRDKTRTQKKKSTSKTNSRSYTSHQTPPQYSTTANAHNHGSKKTSYTNTFKKLKIEDDENCSESTKYDPKACCVRGIWFDEKTCNQIRLNNILDHLIIFLVTLFAFVVIIAIIQCICVLIKRKRFREYLKREEEKKQAMQILKQQQQNLPKICECKRKKMMENQFNQMSISSLNTTRDDFQGYIPPQIALTPQVVYPNFDDVRY